MLSFSYLLFLITYDFLSPIGMGFPSRWCEIAMDFSSGDVDEVRREGKRREKHEREENEREEIEERDRFDESQAMYMEALLGKEMNTDYSDGFKWM